MPLDSIGLDEICIAFENPRSKDNARKYQVKKLILLDRGECSLQYVLIFIFFSILSLCNSICILYSNILYFMFMPYDFARATEVAILSYCAATFYVRVGVLRKLIGIFQTNKLGPEIQTESTSTSIRRQLK